LTVVSDKNDHCAINEVACAPFQIAWPTFDQNWAALGTHWYLVSFLL